MAIEIKPSHRGLFTAKAKKSGETVREKAKEVLKNGSHASVVTKKQAIFAENAKKWNHSKKATVKDFLSNHD